MIPWHVNAAFAKRLVECESLDPCARWRDAIGAARIMSRFAKGDGANDNKKDQLALGSDDEDNTGSRSGSPSLGTTPEPDPKSQQRFLSPPSPDDRTLRGRVAGLVARGGGSKDDNVGIIVLPSVIS